MSYTTTKILLPSGLDEIALSRSLTRLPNESLYNFKYRLLLEHRNPLNNSENRLRLSPGRNVGAPEIPVAKLVAADANRLTISSTILRVYDGETLLDSISLFDRDHYFVSDVLTWLETYFTVTVIDDSHRLSKKLTLVDTQVCKQVFLAENYVNYIGEPISNPIFGDTLVFKVLKESADAITESGEYYIDEINGVVFSYDLQHGSMSYETNVFPHYLTWSPVRVVSFNDSDLSNLIKDTQVTDEGAVASVLNEKGISYINRLLAAHGLEYAS